MAGEIARVYSGSYTQVTKVQDVTISEAVRSAMTLTVPCMARVVDLWKVKLDPLHCLRDLLLGHSPILGEEASFVKPKHLARLYKTALLEAMERVCPARALTR